jgi:hypothetical protein
MQKADANGNAQGSVVSSRGYRSLRVRDDIDRDTQRHTDTQTQRHSNGNSNYRGPLVRRLIGKYDSRTAWHVGTERSGVEEWSGEERSGVKGKEGARVALVCTVRTLAAVALHDGCCLPA